MKIPSSWIGFFVKKYRQNWISDLENKIIRFIWNPEDRIKEDPIRLLRYVRFKYDLNLEDPKNYSQKYLVEKNFDLIKNVAFERIKVELEKIFVWNNVAKAIDELKKLWFFKIFIPEIDILNTIPWGPKYHLEWNVWIHILMIIEYLEKSWIKDTSLYWTALFHDTWKATTYKFRDDHSISYIW